MMFIHDAPIQPKKPGPLRVLTLGRVSTLHQDPKMLDVQHGEVQRFLHDSYQGPTEITELGEQVSGEEALRSSYIRACEIIENDEVDLVVLFDLSKAGRLPRFMHQFIDLCVDHETRFVSVGDNIDTADDNWEIAAGAASLVHGTYNRHTRHRIKAKGDYAFHRGGMVTKVPFGYRKLTLEEADGGGHGPKGLRIARIAGLTPVIREMAQRVVARDSYEDVAGWLQDEGVPRGPYAKGGWTGKGLRQYLRLPLLHGVRERSRTQITRERTTGRKKRRTNPAPLVETYAELAHLTPQEHGELLAEMDRRVAAHPRHQRAKVGPRGRARSKTLFPGQIMTCGVCGSIFYWCGNKGLKCSNCGDPAQGRCWNHVQVDPEIVRREIDRVLLRELQARPDAKAAMVQAVLAECDRLRGREGRQMDQTDAQIKSLRDQKDRLATAIRKGGDIDVLLEQLKEADARLKDLTKQRERAAATPAGQPVAATIDEVEANLPEILAYLMANSYEFADLMRRVIPVFTLAPMQAVDTGKPVARAHVTFSFASMLQSRQPESYQPLSGDFSVSLDLFDPPTHIRCLQPAIRLREEHPDWSAQQIAEAIGPGTKRWSVRSALKLYAKMQKLGVSAPYVPVTDPTLVSRWKMENSREPRWDQTK